MCDKKRTECQDWWEEQMTSKPRIDRKDGGGRGRGLRREASGF